MRVTGHQFGRILVLTSVLLLAISSASAQGSGTALTVTLAAEPSIQITFAQTAGGCPLSPAPDDSHVILHMGTFDNNGAHIGCASYSSNTPNNARYTISTGYNLQVRKFNSGSASYTLSVRLQSPPPGPSSALAYFIRQGQAGNQVELTTAPRVVITTGNYGSDYLQVLSIQVHASTAPVGLISQTIEYTAVAN